MKAIFSILPPTFPMPLYPTWFRWKEAHSVEDKLHYLLYIPHGSDERFYVKGYGNKRFVFISHMVQMKGRKQTELNWNFKLYIPHGSDESLSLKRFWV